MKPTPWLQAEPYRTSKYPWISKYGDNYGAFRIPYKGVALLVLVSAGENGAIEFGDAHAWDHISVSAPNRTPTWQEMDYIKDIFWNPDETVMQLHVPKSEHINCHPNVLHLWKPLLIPIPRPPSSAV